MTPFVGEAEQELLACRELRHVDVHRPVGQHTPADRERKVAVERARQQLAADRVTHVVGHEVDLVEPQRDGDTGDQVGLLEQRVGLIGFG
jgi:hypothetical protein